MTFDSDHHCDGMHCIIVQDGEVYYELWQGSENNGIFGLYTARELVKRRCPHCHRSYMSVSSDHQREYGITIPNWENFLANPTPVIMRAML